MSIGDTIARLDAFQQRHRAVAFPLAVRKKYADDQGGYLSATIAYYGFFSFFPLLLVLVTVLGYVLDGHPHLEHRILGSALGQLPVIGSELQQNGLKGSGLALAIGIVAAVWTGTGVLLAAENAMSVVWDIPKEGRLGFVASRLRALGLLGALGGSLLATTVLSGIGTAGARFGIAIQIVSVGASLAVDFGLLWLAFRLLTPSKIAWRCLRGGAAAAAVAYEALQLLGSYYVTHTLKSASNVYGTFALVIGLLSWIYLTSTIVLLAAEANVVATRKLWPRPLTQPPSA
jgi:YihY family inner membrane protein